MSKKIKESLPKGYRIIRTFTLKGVKHKIAYNKKTDRLHDFMFYGEKYPRWISEMMM